MQIQVIMAYVFGLALLLLLTRLLMVPLKYLFRLVINAVIGLFLLMIFNLVGSFFHLYLPFNPVTALVAGFLGIPGVILMMLLRHFILAS